PRGRLRLPLSLRLERHRKPLATAGSRQPASPQGRSPRASVVQPRLSRDGFGTPSCLAWEVLDLLLPKRCVVCDAGGSQLCLACRDDLPRLEPPLCARCGAPVAWPVERCRECAGRRIAFATARAAVGYDEAARRLVHSWKERGLRRLAAEAAALVV